MHLHTCGRTIHVGELAVYARGGLATSHFTYEPEFLYGADGFPLDNAARLDDEPIQTRGLPMFIDDTGPDRWGKLLLQREAHNAGQGSLDDLDFIARASDLARQGPDPQRRNLASVTDVRRQP